jgi:hypothetical protein
MLSQCHRKQNILPLIYKFAVGWCVDSGGLLDVNGYYQDSLTDSKYSRPVLGYNFNCSGSENKLSSCAQYNMTSRCYAQNIVVRCGESNYVDWFILYAKPFHIQQLYVNVGHLRLMCAVGADSYLMV